jgi:hypothetical protein
MGARDWIAALLLSAALVTPMSRALESSVPLARGAAGLGGVCLRWRRRAGWREGLCVRASRSAAAAGSWGASQRASELVKD